MQLERIWTNANSLSLEERRWLVSSNNPECPFSRIIGNKEALRFVQTIAFKSLGRNNHRCGELPVAFTGPPGVGKTLFSETLAEVTGLPRIEINSNEVKSTDDVFRLIDERLKESMLLSYNGAVENPGLVSYRSQEPDSPEDPEGRFYFAPSCIVFFDEVHNLPSLGGVSQGLLHAVERKTHRLVTSDGKVLDTSAILFIFATTHWGEVFPALRTRFQQIQLQPYSSSEVAQIVKLNFPFLSNRVCERIAFFTWRVTREAIRLAELVCDQRDMLECSWEEAIDQSRQMLRIDPLGMTLTRLSILQALQSGPLSMRAILNIAHCDEKELVEDILPPLRIYGNNVKPLIRVGGRGFELTEEGQNELDKRNALS